MYLPATEPLAAGPPEAAAAAPAMRPEDLAAAAAGGRDANVSRNSSPYPAAAAAGIPAAPPAAVPPLPFPSAPAAAAGLASSGVYPSAAAAAYALPPGSSYPSVVLAPAGVSSFDRVEQSPAGAVPPQYLLAGSGGAYSPSSASGILQAAAGSAEDETQQQQQQRRSTDVGWLYGFCCVCLFCLCFCWLALSEGSPARLTRGINYQGKTCGADGSVKDLPFLYAPLDPREAYALLLLQDARCVAACPTETDVEAGSTIPVNIRETDVDEQRSSALAVQFLLQSPTYASTAVAGAYCMPLDSELRSQFFPLFSSTFRQQQLAVGDATYQACGVVLGYSLLALLAAATLTLLLRFSPGLLLAAAAVWSVAVAFLAAGALFRNALPALFSSDKGSMFPLDYACSLLGGVALLALGAAAIFFFFAARRSLGKAARVLDCAAEVIFDMPQLFVTPLIFSIATIIWAWLWMRLYAYMFSAGNLDRTEIPFGLDRNGDVAVLGLHRRVVWDARFLFFRFLWVAVLCFSFELLYACGRFCLSYAATVWYFSPAEKEGEEERDVGFCPALVALSLAATHHTGSFVLAALLLPFTRPLRALRAAAAAAAADPLRQQQGLHLDSHRTNSSAYFLRAAATGMQNLLQPFGEIMEQLTPSGFIEIAISSKPFFPAMQTTCARFKRSTSPAAYLHGISQLASLICCTAISLTIGLLCYTTLTNTEKYASLASPSFVSAPLFVSAYVAFIAAFVCMHFSSIWEAVADTLMYCFLVESTQFAVIDENPLTKVHAPLSLRELLLDELQGNL